MKKHFYGIVNADNGQQIGFIPADSMRAALEKFAEKMPAWAYEKNWMFAHIGDAPYIVTDTVTIITAFEY